MLQSPAISTAMKSEAWQQSLGIWDDVAVETIIRPGTGFPSITCRRSPQAQFIPPTLVISRHPAANGKGQCYNRSFSV